MARKVTSAEGPAAPPYGPARGMLEGLHLLQRMSPARVDAAFLRAHHIAPGNEYKVVGSLRYLGLIDEDGRPTEKSRLLKTRGPAYLQGLQQIVRTAYQGLFSSLNLVQATREEIYNYFITEAGVGPEMAAKTTRFFIDLCQEAGIILSPGLRKKGISGRQAEPRAASTPGSRPQSKKGTADPLKGGPQQPFPLVFALTPEMARLDEEELVEFFRKMKLAFRRAFQEEQ